MAQTQKAEEKDTRKENEQIDLKETAQTQTPASRQAGFNQPSEDREGDGPAAPRRELSRREDSSFLNPFSFMARFGEEMDRLFEDFGLGGGLLTSGPRDLQSSMWSPQTEVFQRAGKFVVQADLPGLNREDINVDIEEDQLIIRGERRSERQNEGEGFYQTERRYGGFYRSIALPQNIDIDQADATFRNGVLEITMPLPEEKQRSRRLEISEGERSPAKQEKGGKK